VKTTKYLIIVTGPTAVGKTSMAVELAKHFNTEVISADSRQFFRELSIGTAKPSEEERSGITHHFIDSHSIKEDYNVGKFENEAITLIEKLFSTKDVLIVAGGSGLYIDAICKGFDNLPEADPEIREKLKSILHKKGIAGLQELLKELDPDHYKTADLNNPQRLSRALEVCLSTRRPYSSMRKGKAKDRNFSTIKIGLNTSRDKLYERINERVDSMMENGLLEEVKSVKQYRAHNALQTVGYKELFEYLDGDISLERAIELIKQHTRNFAKRQLTWFNRDEEIEWFEPSDKKSIIAHINQKMAYKEEE
jgi:tRNA dimethylallyltransferase